MKLSFSSLALVNDPFDWAYDLEELGFTGWEVVSEGKQQLNDETLSKIRNIVETTDLVLTLHLPFSDLNLASLNHPIWKETTRQMCKCLERASDFIELAVVHPGHLSPLGMQLPEMAWRQNIEGLRSVCDFAGDYGISIGVENMVNMQHIFGKQPGEILGMIESLERENAGLTLDMGHAHTNGMVSEFLKDLGRVIHVHLHDNKGRRDDHLELGKGNIKWDEVMGKFDGYKGRFVIEARTVEEGTASLKYLHNLDM
ncbi:MAG: sugar phosphate isomerase/epimerase [Candidatus Methanoperedens sp.]|nr:sugar phosphate isomerase/epimerase [Candidatus Methanoperedens sp.]MCZ7369378.1 sugar phosphate isomerase/epimerase [Candidatus Methanoperedens sp.]